MSNEGNMFLESLKESLKVIFYPMNKKKRLGCQNDGGYVIGTVGSPGLGNDAPILNYDCCIFCGIGENISFASDFLFSLHPEINNIKNIDKKDVYAFDNSIDEYPDKELEERKVQFIKKHINTFNDANNTNLFDLLGGLYSNIFMQMDIEGAEFPWIDSLSTEQLKRFKQIVIEFHGINDVDDSWGASRDIKLRCLKKMAETHYIIHIHGNNYGGKSADIPNIVEITYLNKDCFLMQPPPLNHVPFPIPGLDSENCPGKPDYILETYPFCVLSNRKQNRRIYGLK